MHGRPKKADRLSLIGRDEMNLAEFALGVASGRNAKDRKTIERRRRQTLPDGTQVDQKWVVTGADKYGLPLPGDDDVILVLLKLATDQGIIDRVVHFSRYEAIQLLRWPLNGKSYRRLEEALERLTGVHIQAKNCFWSAKGKRYLSVAFGLLDDYQIFEHEVGRTSPDQLRMPLTFVRFNEVFFQSLQEKNIKRLDLSFYLGLNSTISKRLYRVLDKRSHQGRKSCELEIYTLASVNLGLDLEHIPYASQIKQKLDIGHRELSEQGYLQSWSYRLSADGQTWFVRYTFAKPAFEPAPTPELSDEETAPGLVQLLLDQGFSQSMAKRLSEQYPDRIQEKLDYFTYLKQHRRQLLDKNPAGWLRKAIEEDYSAPAGYETPQFRQERQQVENARKWAAIDEERRGREEAERNRQLFESLPESKRLELVKQARERLAFLPPSKREALDEDSPVIRAEIAQLLKEMTSEQAPAS